MDKVSIIIPARNELYLTQTVDDIFKKATGDIEVFVVFDGCERDPTLIDRNGLTIIEWKDRKGMRAAVNTASQLASGKYLLKSDAHCLFCEGFDETLKSECDNDWIVTPKRFSLDPDKWIIREKRPVEYEYLCWPVDPANHGLHAKYWWFEREKERKEFLVDENMSFQGSSWFIPKEYFNRRIYPLQEEGYGTFIGEAVEIGLKIWLSGGKCILNKKTWYAHLWKGQDYRDRYKEKIGTQYTRIGHSEWSNGNKYCVDFWMNDRPFEGRIHNLAWLIEKFWPVPTWPEDREKWKS